MDQTPLRWHCHRRASDSHHPVFRASAPRAYHADAMGQIRQDDHEQYRTGCSAPVTDRILVEHSPRSSIWLPAGLDAGARKLAVEAIAARTLHSADGAPASRRRYRIAARVWPQGLDRWTARHGVRAIAAETFVSMPFFIVTLESGLRAMNTKLEDAARSLGASRSMVFRRVTLPLIWPSLIAGTVLTWSRALGEFGATITFAGNLPGVTQTTPLAIYISQSSGQLDTAIALSLVLVAVSLIVMMVTRSRSGAGSRSRA